MTAAARLKMYPDLLMELENLVCSITTCEACEGSGTQTGDKSSACYYCGGVGEVCASGIMVALEARKLGVIQ